MKQTTLTQRLLSALVALCMVLCGTLLVHHGTESGETHKHRATEADKPLAGRGGE